MESVSASTRRKNYHQEDMVRALRLCNEQKMAISSSAKLCKVPKTTLHRLIKSGSSGETHLGRKPVFSMPLESLLVDYLLEMERRFFGMTRTDLKRLAYQLAKANKLKNPFNSNNEAAGKKWLSKFMHRHPELSFRKPESTSIARVRGFNRESVDSFYDLLEEVGIDKFPADRIFNVDETGVSIVQSRNPQIIALKGKKQVGILSAAERGALITVVCAMSPAGIFVPPLIVFPLKKMPPASAKDGAPHGTIFRCHQSGWIQTWIFSDWFRHFVNTVKPSKDSPALLLLDGHYSHTHNLEIIEMARSHYVTLLSIPPHTSHRLQPLDVSFMGPFKQYYANEIRNFYHEFRRPVEVGDVAMLLGKAFKQTCQYKIAENGFKSCGIFPFNRHIFMDSDFLDETPVNISRMSLNVNPDGKLITPAAKKQSRNSDVIPTTRVLFPTPVTSEPVAVQSAPTQCTLVQSDSSPAISSTLATPQTPSTNTTPQTPSTNTTPQSSLLTNLQTPTTSKHSPPRLISPEEIREIPFLQKKKAATRGRPAQKPTILTYSPYKNELAASIASKAEKDAKKAEREAERDAKKAERDAKKVERGAKKKEVKKVEISAKKKEVKKANKTAKTSEPMDQDIYANPVPSTSVISKKATDNKSKQAPKRKCVRKKLEPESSSESEQSRPDTDDSLQDDTDEFDDENPTCFYCHGRYFDYPREEWIQCTGNCERWCHVDCAGVDKTELSFLCEFC